MSYGTMIYGASECVAVVKKDMIVFGFQQQKFNILRGWGGRGS